MAGNEIKAGRAIFEVSLRDRVGKGLKSIERKLANTGRNVATLGASLAAGGLAAVAWPLKLAADMEQTSVAFEVMTGSAESAKKLLDELKSFAASTPFGFTELAENSRLLMSYGVATEDVVSTMRILGDVSGGSAEKLGRLSLAYGQVMAKGRLMGGEVNQMVENGFNPLKEISRTTGKSVAELTKEMENGGISAAMVTGAFVSATSAGGKFAGMMDKQSRTGLGLFSTLLDNVTMALTDFGLSLLETLKPGLNLLVGLSGRMREFATANARVLKILGLVAIGVVAVGSVLTVLGLAAMAAATIAGGLAMAWGAVVAAFGFLFTPLGIALVALTALGVAAFYFRDALASALASVASYFSPLTDAIGRVWSIFQQTFGAIIDALSNGQLEQAAAIAWLGFKAAGLQGLAELGGIVEMALDMLGAWIPGVDAIVNYLREAFGSVGQAILTGNWGLAGQILMGKLRLSIEKGWNSISFIWSSFTIGLMTVFESMGSAIRRTFREAVFAIAGWITWVGEKFGLISKGATDEVARMKAQAQKEDDKSVDRRSNARFTAAQAKLDAAKAREDELRRQLEELEQRAADAYASAGSPTIEAVASGARAELEQAIAAAEEERKKAAEGTPGSPAPAKLAAAAQNSIGKVESRGSFSAAAAAIFGLGATDDTRATAQNTKAMSRELREINNKMRAGQIVG